MRNLTDEKPTPADNWVMTFQLTPLSGPRHCPPNFPKKKKEKREGENDEEKKKGGGGG